MENKIILLAVAGIAIFAYFFVKETGIVESLTMNVTRINQLQNELWK